MIENLLAHIILLTVNLIQKEEYIRLLDNLFLKDSSAEILLELEWLSSDMEKSKSIIFKYSDANDVKYDLFGAVLFKKLKEIYLHQDMDIVVFGAKAYEIWRLLPHKIQEIEPFWTMSFADDPLSWGDEQQARALYEGIFNYYKDE